MNRAGNCDYPPRVDWERVQHRLKLTLGWAFEVRDYGWIAWWDGFDMPTLGLYQSSDLYLVGKG